jgi:succinate-acetate transporter protein
MTNEEWIVEKWKKFTKWYAKRVWWFVLLFAAIVTTLLILGAKTDNDALMYFGGSLMVLLGVCSTYGIANWLELEHKEAGK